MDIISAHPLQVNANPAQSDTNQLTVVGTEWLDLALLIEERQ